MAAKKKEPKKIKVISFVHVGDELVETSQLNPEQKHRLATWLKVTYLNHLYAGKAVFWVGSNDEHGRAGEDPDVETVKADPPVAV